MSSVPLKNRLATYTWWTVGLICVVAILQACNGSNSYSPPRTNPTSTPRQVRAPTTAPDNDYILWNQASSYAGQRKIVCGPVVDSNYARSTSGRPTFLNLGKPYPQAGRFTIVIWGEDRSNFSFSPESYYRGKTICAVGLIELYQGSPEIEVSSPQQIAVDE
ncbi:MAG: hypothetical protein FVQ79_04295 [Planctomycetes bacterium]|nr:hypothetical protein [Planctomycetota bacterium]